MADTLFDKIWNLHRVKSISGGLDVLYIDRHYIHEVTSPQAFYGLEKRNLKLRKPELTYATVDHNVPTVNQHLPVKQKSSREQIEQLTKNCKDCNIHLFPLCDPENGIVHVIGPELGLTLPGTTIVCGDSHTSTHGAFGSIAFGIGTSEVEMVMASQCIIQKKPKQMLIFIDGFLRPGVSSKDLALHLLKKIKADGAAGHFIEYKGPAIDRMSMENRMTLCNMSIEMGARGALIVPDSITLDYLKNRKYAPVDDQWRKSVKYWTTLKTDIGAKFNRRMYIDATEVKPMITYGTSPDEVIAIDEYISWNEKNRIGNSSLHYMNFKPGEPLAGKKVDYVFIGSCTNGRIEDLREAAFYVKGKKVKKGIHAMVVPGSRRVMIEAEQEGLADIFREAGFEFREPGCSACLAMNGDIVPYGKYCVSTSNRNFEGRQGPGARTILASPGTAAISAVNGVITDTRDYIE